MIETNYNNITNGHKLKNKALVYTQIEVESYSTNIFEPQ